MYDGKARNAIIKYELKLDHEGNYDGKDDAANELVIDEDEVFDNKAPGLIDDGGDDSFLNLSDLMMLTMNMNMRMKKN